MQTFVINSQAMCCAERHDGAISIGLDFNARIARQCLVVAGASVSLSHAAASENNENICTVACERKQNNSNIQYSATTFENVSNSMQVIL